MANIEKFQELMKDEAFVKELLEQESKEDAQIFLEKNGVELSMAEVEEIEKAFEKIASGELSQDMLEKAANGELSEEELEEVAGGIAPLVIAIIVGVAIGGTGGTLYGLSEHFRWRW